MPCQTQLNYASNEVDRRNPALEVGKWFSTIDCSCTAPAHQPSFLQFWNCFLQGEVYTYRQRDIWDVAYQLVICSRDTWVSSSGWNMMSILGNDTLPVPLACLFPETVLMGLQAQVSSRFFPFHLCSTPHLALGQDWQAMLRRGTGWESHASRLVLPYTRHPSPKTTCSCWRWRGAAHPHRFRHGHVA